MNFTLPIPATPSHGEMKALKDDDLKQWLLARHVEKHTVVLVHAGHRCKVYDATIANTTLLPADPDNESAKALKKLASASLLKRIELPQNEFELATIPNTAWTLLNAASTDVSEWMKRRAALFGQGRGKPISTNTAKLVWHDAGGRCMYRGCSEDLGRTTLTIKTSKIGYLAHIVASDPDGPRGDPATSHALSDDPENIMLMCDGHHRLIDRIDEDGHTAVLLKEMRRERLRMVRKVLDGMSYPRAQVVTLLGDIANIQTSASERDMHAAMLARELAPLPDIVQSIRRTQRDDRLPPDFWDRFLHEHELEIRDLLLRFSNHQSGGGGTAPDVLAIFPLHLVPALILAGRIIGEARPVKVFQYDRHRQTWQWDLMATPQPANTFQFNVSSDDAADEVLISLELSADIDERALPEFIAGRVHDGSIPWVRVTSIQPNPGCIRHPDDLEQFTNVARETLRIIQDGIRPTRVHLLGVSPASTLFRFGQLLQAGHHPAFSVYDRPDQTQPFKPGLSIEGQRVTAATSFVDSKHTTIQLR